MLFGAGGTVCIQGSGAMLVVGWYGDAFDGAVNGMCAMGEDWKGWCCIGPFIGIDGDAIDITPLGSVEAGTLAGR
jgi:hypothetical protein